MIIGNLLAAFNSFKLQSSVRIFGGSTATLTVPSGQIFKGIISNQGLISNGGYWGFTIRDTNAGGAVLGAHLDNAGGATITSGNTGNTKYVELSAGTYHFSANFSAASWNPVFSVIGGLYANS